MTHWHLRTFTLHYFSFHLLSGGQMFKSHDPQNFLFVFLISVSFTSLLFKLKKCHNVNKFWIFSWPAKTDIMLAVVGIDGTLDADEARSLMVHTYQRLPPISFVWQTWRWSQHVNDAEMFNLVIPCMMVLIVTSLRDEKRQKKQKLNWEIILNQVRSQTWK